MNILLICSAGMSTSMMMKRMKEAAAAKHIDANIWVVGEGLAKENIAKADIILLGPQVRYLFQKIEDMAEGKPVMVMDLSSYGNLDGKRVLENVLIRMRGQIK